MPASESTARLEHLSGLRMPLTAQAHHQPRLDVRRAVQSSVVQNSFFERPRGPAAADRIEISFGSFCLLPTQFLLLEHDKPVPLGSRALEILIALLERPGELVSKEELMARVWPDGCAGSANLTRHLSAPRRTLRCGTDQKAIVSLSIFQAEVTASSPRSKLLNKASHCDQPTMEAPRHAPTSSVEG